MTELAQGIWPDGVMNIMQGGKVKQRLLFIYTSDLFRLLLLLLLLLAVLLLAVFFIYLTC
jgi:hypothetical protein